MILAFALLAALSDWVPMQWPWSEPKTLDLLEHSSINCVLIANEALTPQFAKAAAQRGIAVVAVLHSDARLHPGANAIAIEGDVDSSFRASLQTTLPVIELPSRQKIRLDSTDAVTGTYQGLWPGIVIEHNGKVMTGPSSNPWVDTNTGFLHFLRAATDSAVWIGSKPPVATVVPPERYGIAIADAAAAGARWIITLDTDLQRRLFVRDPHALADWKQITGYVRYFEEHREWRSYRPFSRMALTQDASSGGLLSASLLDLMYAQRVAARALPPERLNEQSLSGLRTLINVAPPSRFSPEQKQALAKFAESGGSLITAPPSWRFGTDAPGATVPSRKQLANIQEIWEMLYNATARKNFGVRTFNTAGILFNVLAAPDEKRLLIHLVNYTQLPADSITVQALGTWKRARLYRPNQETQELNVYAVKDGTAVDVEKLDVLATLLLE